MTMLRPQSIQRLWTTKVRPHSSTRIHLSAVARCRTDLPLEHSRRRNQYQAYPTRLRASDQTAIKEYLAISDTHPAVIGFLSSVAFVRGITGYNFVDRHLLLQALYGESGSENPQQRLAMLGDTLLQYVLKDDWFQLGMPASQIGNIAAQVATNANLADVAKEIGLVRHLGSLDPRIKERTNEHRLGTIVEALLGAIHEDSGKDIAAVRRAMHQMGLMLPDWYTFSRSASYSRDLQNARFELKTLDLHKATSEPSQPDLQKARFELSRPELQRAKPELNQPELQNARSETNLPDLHKTRSESDHVSIRKTHPEKLPPKRERRRLKAFRQLQDKINQGLPEDEDSNQGSTGYQFQTIEEQVTSDEDFETPDAARARLDDMSTDEKSPDYCYTEHASVEDVESKQAHLEDQDPNQTYLETSATHQESIEPTAAEFTSSSWKELIRRSDDSSTEPETARRRERAESPVTEFDRAMGAFMIESDGSLVERELVGRSEWPARHGWFPQRCQITLDIALSKEKGVAAHEPEQLRAAPSLEDIALSGKPHMTKEVAAPGLDELMFASTPDDVSPEELLSKKELAAGELNGLMAAITLEDVAISEKPRTAKKVASRKPNQLLVTSTPDDVGLPKKIQKTKKVASREPNRLLLASTPDDSVLSKKIHTTEDVAAYEPHRMLAVATLDDIALPKLAYTTKAVTAYEPDRLRLIVAPL